MGSILILLFLFVVATVLVRGQLIKSINAITTTPLLIGLGYLLSPQVLGIALPSLIEGLVPALRLAILWVAFLIGLRFTFWVLKSKNKLALLEVSVIALLTVSFMVSVTYFWFSYQRLFFVSREQVWSLSFVVGVLISSSSFSVARQALVGFGTLYQKHKLLLMTNHDDLFSVCAVMVGLMLWPTSPEAQGSWNPMGALASSVAVGSVLALAVRLLIEPGRTEGVHWRLALVGLATLGAGGAVGALANEALVGFIFGLLLANLYRKPMILDPILRSSEAPVRLVLYFLAGVYLEVTWPALMTALVLVSLRWIVKWGVQRVLWDGKEALLPLSAITGVSGLALPVAFSFFLSPAGIHGADLILSAVVLSLFLSDLVTLALWPWGKKKGGTARD